MAIRIAANRNSRHLSSDTCIGVVHRLFSQWGPSSRAGKDISKHTLGGGKKFTSLCRSLMLRTWSRALQSGFGLIFRQILGELPANFSANFSRNIFGLVSPGIQAPPPQFTPKIVGIPLQFQLFEPNFFFTPIFCLRGRPREPLDKLSPQRAE